VTDLWRISNYADLKGQGGLSSPGRWHSRGRPVVYLAASPAGALVEILVHLELAEESLPDSYQLLKVRVPDSVSREVLDRHRLPSDWADRLDLTRELGGQWLASRRTALLGVPSAVVAETLNWLLNPVHPHARRIKIAWARRFPLDGRLLKPGPEYPESL
jgi:RES domain-containing protein